MEQMTRGPLRFVSQDISRGGKHFKDCRRCYFSYRCSIPGKWVRCPRDGVSVWVLQRPATVIGRIAAFVDKLMIALRAAIGGL